MLFKLAPLVLAASAFAQTFSVNTPASLPQCLPAQIQITGGTAPFTLAAIPAGQASAPAIATIATGIAASPYVWTVNLPTGLNITLRVTDNTGALTYSSPLVIQAGASSSCLNASASTSGLQTVSVSGATSSIAATTSVSTSLSVSSSLSASISGSSVGVTTSLSTSTSVSTSVPAASASSTSRAWAIPSAVAGVPAVAMAALGGVAVLF